MGFRGTALLLLLLGALGVALWLSDAAPKNEPALTDAVLDGRSMLTADHVFVRSQAGALPVEFERQGSGTWRVVEPIRDLASAAILEKLRTAFDSAQLIVAYEPDEVTEKLLDETGLAEPQGFLRVTWPDGVRVELAIGLPGPYGQDLFARRVEDGASKRIYRVQTALLNALRFTPTDAREMAVFRTEATQVAAIRVDRRLGDGDVAARDVLRLVRRGSSWVMEQPAPLRIDPNQSDGFVRAVLGLRIDGFLLGRPEPGMSSIDFERDPDVVIDVEGAFGPERVRLFFAPEKITLVGHNDLRDIWFTCETRGYERVVELPIRSLRAFWILNSPVDSLRVLRVVRSDGSAPFELAKQGVSEFRIVQPIARSADATAVSELLQALRSLAVLEFVADDVRDFTPYGLGDGALVVEAADRPGRPQRILIGDDAGPDTTWLRRADERNVVTIPRAVAERFRRPWHVYVDRQILRVADGALVQQINRAPADGPVVEFRRGSDGKWRRGAETEPLPRVADLFDVLRDLRAKQVVPEAEVADGADDCGTLELVAPSGQRIGRIALSRHVDGRVLCQHADAPGVRFVLGARDGGDLVDLR